MHNNQSNTISRLRRKAPEIRAEVVVLEIFIRFSIIDFNCLETKWKSIFRLIYLWLKKRGHQISIGKFWNFGSHFFLIGSLFLLLIRENWGNFHFLNLCLTLNSTIICQTLANDENFWNFHKIRVKKEILYVEDS